MPSHMNNIWLSYLSHVLVNKCIQLAKRHCPACTEGFKSPLLHYHVQLSLLEKIKCYFEEARGPMIADTGKCFECFIKVCNIDDVSENNYLFTGQTFLLMVSAESIYYGRYISEESDAVLFPKPTPDAVKIMNGCYPCPSNAVQGSKATSNKRKKVEKKKIVDTSDFEFPLSCDFD